MGKRPNLVAKGISWVCVDLFSERLVVVSTCVIDGNIVCRQHQTSNGLSVRCVRSWLASRGHRANALARGEERRENAEAEQYTPVPQGPPAPPPPPLIDFGTFMQGLVQAMQTQAQTQAPLQAQVQAQERADVWWSSILRIRLEDGDRQVTWDEFTCLFKAKFIPEHVQDKMGQEFLSLTEGSMSVQEYEARFVELLKYVPHIVADERRKVKKIVMELRPSLRTRLVAFDHRTMEEALSAACKLRVVHRDLKVSKILLDDEWNPKIVDFGLARIFSWNDNEANTKCIIGTYGYMPPEYAMKGLFSTKSDVYSFGVLILEILSGKKNTSIHNFGISRNLPRHAWELWQDGRQLELVDPAMGNSVSERGFSRLDHVALLCVQENPRDRPTMLDTMSMLNSDSANFLAPGQPTFFMVKRANRGNDLQMQNVLSSNSVTLTSVEGR
ncbi:hypothetical protein Taro_002364 [Colocasia esculenta]|uniref:Protein kinase domain-containing protein n=1 Tax=Colocasia esculenta TaxID=4460 RepID=A0A843TH10_COLES|nr:hypothetical protein [Colocasia esculenta]